ncbi:DUF4249 domain-containing protein [Marivirga sp. S37H4]|uniref:DUF4249 domain-containing protein n=1 Tax=Marivirga aurantiaca TaxID=2802615 RepID=A0A935CAB4_9BACT|nr:DUF4249 family protein [Marivirga aurantiaca]MBK6266666.1 DUF4249 domain-containing protein [Marivirga aurantiaca]
MKYLKQFILFICVIATSLGCQELIELDLAQSEPRVVIEGRITDQSGPHKIKISRTVNYYDAGKIPPLTDANVQLLDSAENLIEQFTYNSEDSTYRSSDGLKGKIDKSYILSVEADGDRYYAKGKILPNATLDSVYYLSAETLKQLGQPVFGEGYFLFANGSINRQGTQFFRLQLTVNDTLKDSRGDISNSILSSEFFGNNFEGLPIPGSYQKNDTIDMELYTLNEDVYQYYIEFINLLFSDGGVFSPPPVNPTNNIENLTSPNKFALGFVQFSSVIREQLIIEE